MFARQFPPCAAAALPLLLLVLPLLLQLASGNSDLEASDSDLQTKNLFDAVESDDADGVRAAVAAGARINERDAPFTQGKQTPLMFASLTGRTRALKALLALNADATIGEQDGCKPPAYAMQIILLLAALPPTSPTLTAGTRLCTAPPFKAELPPPKRCSHMPPPPSPTRSTRMASHLFTAPAGVAARDTPTRFARF